MRRTRRHAWVGALLVLPLLLLGCSDDDNPTAPPADTTAPQVLNVDPSNGDVNVDVAEAITITFNEAMDPATADGNVTLSVGTVTGLTWQNDHTLVVAHDPFPEATQVTVTVGTGLTDTAGNALAAAYSFSFWTASSTFTVLATDPAAGAVDVILNPVVTVTFSQQPDMATMSAAVSMGTGKVVDIDRIEDLGDNTIGIYFGGDLPVSTQITITISTAAASITGVHLAEDYVFSFTTGTTADTTPPQLVSVEPADGSTFPPDIGYFRLTFSEPIDADDFEPTEVNGQLGIYIMNVEPVWSDGGRVVTIPLPELPAGVTFHVVFDHFRDLAGNVDDTGFTWTGSTTGTPDTYPVWTDRYMVYFGPYVENDGGVEDDGFSWIGYRFAWEDQAQGDLKREAYLEPGVSYNEWDYLRKTATGLLLRGFHEYDAAEGTSADIMFSPLVDYLHFPMEEESWQGTATITTPDGDMDLVYSVQVLPGTTEVEIPAFKRVSWSGAPAGKTMERMYWSDCRTAVLHYEISMGGELAQTGNDTLHVVPGIGLVEYRGREEDLQEGSWRWEQETLLMFDMSD